MSRGVSGHPPPAPAAATERCQTCKDCVRVLLLLQGLSGRLAHWLLRTRAGGEYRWFICVFV